ncbi:hypothetical protein [uncultured Enterococcus sp.]|uniref:hypothetical protein n=1 Tax=uncultured Enterococcus sp. TaxID=167972 RepID=UPI002AA75D3B|nr:hypothetical protein [uncultured Enterococcus sp.]
MSEIEMVQSIDFYKKIYRKACNSFWALRLSFFVLAVLGVIVFSFIAGILINQLLFNNIEDFNIILVLKVLTACLIMVGPLLVYVYNNVKKKQRSARYTNFLLKMKNDRNLDDDSIDELLEDIDNLKVKYKEERDYLGALFIKMCKLAVFPITAILFKSWTNDIGVVLFLATVILTVIISSIFSFWRDFDSFMEWKTLGIKNDILLDVVRRELIYMKELS